MKTIKCKVKLSKVSSNGWNEVLPICDHFIYYIYIYIYMRSSRPPSADARGARVVDLGRDSHARDHCDAATTVPTCTCCLLGRDSRVIERSWK